MLKDYVPDPSEKLAGLEIKRRGGRSETEEYLIIVSMISRGARGIFPQRLSNDSGEKISPS